MPTSIEGDCLCRAVRYRASAQPKVNALCHCRSCRMASGAPSVAWTAFPADAFEYTAGKPTTFDSSPGVKRTFCGKCGTPLTYQKGLRASTIDVTTITLDNPEHFAPTKEIWISHRVPWEALNSALAQHPKSSVGTSNEPADPARD